MFNNTDVMLQLLVLILKSYNKNSHSVFLYKSIYYTPSGNHS